MKTEFRLVGCMLWTGFLFLTLTLGMQYFSVIQAKQVTARVLSVDENEVKVQYNGKKIPVSATVGDCSVGDVVDLFTINDLSADGNLYTPLEVSTLAKRDTVVFFCCCIVLVVSGLLIIKG